MICHLVFAFALQSSSRRASIRRTTRNSPLTFNTLYYLPIWKVRYVPGYHECLISITLDHSLSIRRPSPIPSITALTSSSFSVNQKVANWLSELCSCNLSVFSIFNTNKMNANHAPPVQPLYHYYGQFSRRCSNSASLSTWITRLYDHSFQQLIQELLHLKMNSMSGQPKSLRKRVGGFTTQ